MSRASIERRFTTPMSASLLTYLRDSGSIERIDPDREVLLSRRAEHAHAHLLGLLGKLAPGCRASILGRRRAFPHRATPVAAWTAIVTRLALHVARHRGCPGKFLVAEARRAVSDLERARMEFVEANLRLVIHVAKAYARNDIPLLDLIQEGNLGLIRASERFTHRHGTRFSTYAHWWIKQAIQRAVAGQAEVIRVPVRARRRCRRTFALVEELSGERPGELPESLRSPSPQERIESRERDAAVRRLLDQLVPREAQILRLRFGIGTWEEKTLEQVGESLALSRERVRKLQSGALRKLRMPALASGLALPQ